MVKKVLSYSSGIVNTIDAIILSCTAIIKKDRAYTLLNIFWIGVGLIGILRVLGIVWFHFTQNSFFEFCGNEHDPSHNMHFNAQIIFVRK